MQPSVDPTWLNLHPCDWLTRDPPHRWFLLKQQWGSFASSSLPSRQRQRLQNARHSISPPCTSLACHASWAAATSSLWVYVSGWEWLNGQFVSLRPWARSWRCTWPPVFRVQSALPVPVHIHSSTLRRRPQMSHVLTTVQETNVGHDIHVCAFPLPIIHCLHPHCTSLVCCQRRSLHSNGE